MEGPGCADGGMKKASLLFVRIRHGGTAHHPWSLAISGDGEGDGKCPGTEAALSCAGLSPGSDPEDAVQEEAPGLFLVTPPCSSSSPTPLCCVGRSEDLGGREEGMS